MRPRDGVRGYSRCARLPVPRRSARRDGDGACRVRPGTPSAAATGYGSGALQHDPEPKNAVPGAGPGGAIGIGAGPPTTGADGGQQPGSPPHGAGAGAVLLQQPCRDPAQPAELRTATTAITTIRRQRLTLVLLGVTIEQARPA